MVPVAMVGAEAPPSPQVEAVRPTPSMVLPEASIRSISRAVLPKLAKVV
jgi:hypothetical protein